MARGRAKAAGGPIEGPWALPKGWRWRFLGEVVSLAAEKCKPDPTSELPFIGLDSIPANCMRVVQYERFSSIRSTASSFNVGNVLYGRLRPYLNKVWTATISGTCSAEMLVFQPSDDLLADYLRLVLHDRRFVDFATQAVTGDRPRISFDRMAGFAMPLPPIEIQHRVVASINDLFADLDDGEALLARARDDLGTWRKSLLKAAVTGELTADWRAANPPAETGADLLSRILAKRQRVGATFSGTALPAEWVETTIGAVFDVFVGSTPSRGDKQLWNGEVPWVSSGEVAFCRINSTREGIAREALGNSDRRLHPPGTIMLGMIGEGKTRGQAAILDIWAAHNQNCASIRVPETPILPEFVYNFLRERYEVTRSSSSGGNQPALNKARIESFVMPLPPLSEQAEIVARLETAEAAWDDTALDADLSGPLRQSILSAAFRGDLVA